MLAISVPTVRSVMQGRRAGLLVAIAWLALSVATASFADSPPLAVSTLQSTCVMTWPRDASERGVTSIADWSVTRDGRIYVATQGRVKEFGPAGSLLRATQPAFRDGIEYFAVDSKGCVYAVHGGDASLISKFDAQGKLLSADSSEAEGYGGQGTERLQFRTHADGAWELVHGEILSFADQVFVDCREHGIVNRFRQIAVDAKDRICVWIEPHPNPYHAEYFAFDTEGHLLSPISPLPTGVDGQGRKYLWSEQAQATLMYSPTDDVLRVLPKSLPVDGPTFLRVIDVQTTPEGRRAFEAGQEMAGVPGGIDAVDDAGNLYATTVQRQSPPIGLGHDRVIENGLIVYQMDSTGHMLGRSARLPLPPGLESDRYLPRVDPQGRVWWLNFLSDRTEVMRGEFSP